MNARPKQKARKISIVVSVFNEEKIIEKFWDETSRHINDIKETFEIIFVDDGSTDESPLLLDRIAGRDRRAKIIHLSRNYGHEAAMIAGIDNSSGEAVICMDADLQHPPSIINEMIEKYACGYEIIMMHRTENLGAGIIKRAASRAFYWLINKVTPEYFQPNASDFFLISRKVAEILKTEFREKTRFLRGFIQIIGFKSTSISYVAPERKDGESKYSLYKLFRFSINTLAIFSELPLRLGIILGTITGLFSLALGVYSIIVKMMGYVIPGYTTLIVATSFLFAVQFFIIGIMGEYVGFIFIENKQRPIYIIRDIVNKK